MQQWLFFVCVQAAWVMGWLHVEVQEKGLESQTSSVLSQQS